MSKPAKRSVPTDHDAAQKVDQVSEPVAVYTPKVRRKPTSKPVNKEGYDAKRSSGMLPGISKRMKEYLKHVRDGR